MPALLHQRKRKKTIYNSYLRSVLEQSCVVWHNSLTVDNSNDLERVQKSAVKIILGNKYSNYDQALDELNLDSLKTRRNKQCQKFALKCLKNDKTNKFFPLNKKRHIMETKKYEKFKVKFANTERLKKSAIPQMQRLLNQEKIVTFI